MERIINNIQSYIWLGLAVIIIVSILINWIANGIFAYWHIFTALISYVMYKAMYIPAEDDKNNK